ncbi:MAG: C39 family peptidase [Limnochordia bacterium]
MNIFERLSPRSVHVICALIALTSSFQSWAASRSPFWFNSWEELRWEGVVRQTTAQNCGPAALSTLLKTAFSDSVPPDQLVSTDQPSSMMLLRDAAVSRGYVAVGMRMTVEELQRYLGEQQHPVLVRILTPTPHFTTVTGILPGRIITRDPALGRMGWEISDWTHAWSGLALLVQDPDLSEPATLSDEAAYLNVLALLMRQEGRGSDSSLSALRGW